MTDFEYDCLERKRLARQARYRKCGSKSRKCSMSTDRMTNKQWKERCGTVVSIMIGKPASWDTFRGVSKQTKEEYIQNLVDTYGINATSLAAMFNIHPSTVRRYISSAGLNIKFKVGHSMNAEQRKEWGKFLGDEDPQAPSKADEAPTAIAEEPHSTTTTMSMNSFSLSFSGRIDANMIANSLLQILGNNASGRVEIICNLA